MAALVCHLGMTTMCSMVPFIEAPASGVVYQAESKRGIQQGRSSLCAPGNSLSGILMMIQLFASKLYLFHMQIPLQTCIPQLMFMCVEMETAEQKYYWFFFFFFPLIYHSLPHWPRPRMKLPEVLFQVLHSLRSSCFLVQYLCFPDCG